MLALKDTTGSFDEKIEKARTGLSRDYLQILANQCAEWSAKNALTIDEFNRYRSIVQLAGGVDKAGAKKLATEMDPVRRRVLETQCKDALRMFAEAPTLDIYLHGLGVLGRLEKEIATGASESGEVEKARAELRAAYKSAEPKRWFSEDGYPMAREDFGLSKAMSRFGSLVTFHDVEIDRECYLISTSKAQAVRHRQPTKLSFRLIFNQLHQGSEYGVVVRMFEQSGHHEHVLALKDMIVTDGRADVTVTEDFSNVPAEFEPALNKRTGKRHFYAYIAYQCVGKNGPEWRAISPARGWLLDM
jgi:hypothetical protein